MAPWSRITLAALAEDPGTILSTYMVVHNNSLLQSDSFFWLCRRQVFIWYTRIKTRKNGHAHAIKMNKS